MDAFGEGVGSALHDADRAHDMGFDGLWYGEMTGDALDGVLVAATRRKALALGTAVTGGLTHNPMEIAYRLADVRQLADVELRLGVGAQARQVVRHQYGVAWDRPLQQLVEFRRALLAIWEAWSDRRSPTFRGERFHHVYSPEPCIPQALGAPPRVLLGATGARARAEAARQFDGLITHPCTPLQYLRDVIAPEFRAERADHGNERAELVCLTMMLCVVDEEGYERMLHEMRMRIYYWAASGVHGEAFRSVGLSDVEVEARKAMRRGLHERAVALVSDDVVHQFCRIGSPEEIAKTVTNELAGVVDRAVVVLDRNVGEREGRSLVDHIRCG